mmetsp:Transcript_63952/g.171886  ORF Transcript_63952/g.171886 Transcript_63952/m.171886 type:complete len:81 (-) Transcript_63952:48-290(-)
MTTARLATCQNSRAAQLMTARQGDHQHERAAQRSTASQRPQRHAATMGPVKGREALREAFPANSLPAVRPAACFWLTISP